MMGRATLILSIGAMVALLTPTSHGAEREWTDQTGSVKRVGEFDRLDGKWVHIKLTQGGRLRVPIDWLSDADQTFVKSEGGGDGIEVVIVEGVGADVEAARRDAYRAAVRQVLGALIDSQTLVENDQLITDKVVVFSNGFVDRVEDLPGGATVEAGFTRLRVKAFVKAGEVAKSLRKESIGLAGPVMHVEDADSLFARVLTAQERAASARELFLAAVKDYPASCFQAEVFPLNDKSVRVHGNDVECNTRIKISVRQKEYEEFARRLIMYLESEEPFGRGQFCLDQLGGEDFRPIAERIFQGEFGTSLSQSFDRAGDNPRLDPGIRERVWGSIWCSGPSWREDSKVYDFLRRHGRAPGITLICRTASMPYQFEWILTKARGDEWASTMGQSSRCSVVAIRGDGNCVAKRSVDIAHLGAEYAERNLQSASWSIKEVTVFGGWIVDGIAGPAIEFTLPISLPAAEFKRGLKFECRLESLSEDGEPR